MIVDTSALIAIIGREPEGRDFVDAMATADSSLVPAPTLVEASMVASRRGAQGRLDLQRLLERTQTRTIEFTAEHAARAVEAFTVYGKGSGHAAALNFGDCLAYAVASVRDETLLFKGNDFTHTDITPARTAG